MRPLSGVAESPRLVVPPAGSQVSVEPTPSVALVLLAAVLAVVVAAFVWRRRDSPGSGSLTALALGAGWWSLAYALELSSPTLSGTLFFGRLTYVGIAVVPLAWLTFALAYTGRSEVLTRRRLVALALPPVAMIGLAWTTLTTGLIWQRYELVYPAGLSVGVLSVEYGPAFWLWTAYAYALIGVGTILLVVSVARARLFRRQTTVLLIAAAAPWVGNVAFLAGWVPLDVTPVGFVLFSLVLAAGLGRYQLFDVLPVTGGIAREELVERLPEAVVAVDGRDRIVDLNPSAEAVLDTTLDGAVGADLASVAPALADLVADVEPGGVTDYVVSDPRRYYEVRTSPLRGGSTEGRLLTLQDVTERRRREQEIAVLNRVLRHDLRNDVAVIENYATLLQRDPGNEEYVAGIADRATEMRELVETVRRVERHLDAEGPRLSTLNVARVVRERTASLAQSNPEVTVETRLPSEAWVRAMDLVGSAVDNLVENAVEHNDADAPWVRVTVDPVTVDGERYVDVTVADDGPTIADGDRDVLVGRESSLEEASGLGLWLVHWIVSESGGTVSHEPGEGGETGGPRGNVVTLRLRTPTEETEGTDDEGLADGTDAYRPEPTRDRTGSTGASPAG